MRRIATIAACLTALLVPSAAMAQSSTCDAYHPQAGACSMHNLSDADGTLPFTGLDVLLLAVGGGTLAGTGLVVRSLSRRIN